MMMLISRKLKRRYKFGMKSEGQEEIGRIRDKKKMVTYGNIGTFPFVYSLVSRTYTVSIVNIDIPKSKLESSWQRVRY